MLHTALRPRRPGRRCATRAARASASPLPDAPQAIEIGTRRDPARGRRRVALLGYGSGVARALDAAELLARGRHRRDRRRRALRQAARRRADRPALRRARAARHRRGGRPAGRLRLRRVGALQRAGRPDAAHHPRRPARPLRHARQAGAAARARSASPARRSPSGCASRSPSAARSQPAPESAVGGRMAEIHPQIAALLADEPPPVPDPGPPDLAELARRDMRRPRASSAGRRWPSRPPTTC